MAENKVSDMIQESLKSIREIIDVNTVIGTPIITDSGTTIIPVSRIQIGLASGGVDYFSKNAQLIGTEKKKAEGEPQPRNGATKNLPLFGGGGGTGISVTPVGFLVVFKDGRVDMLNVANPTSSGSTIDSVTNFISGAPDLIERFKAVFAKESSAEADIDDIEDQQ
ncbi:MAG: spore germination protein GerW family protein [Eubacteriales bacterium]|jgi:sporulation protein YtfJ